VKTESNAPLALESQA
jgi:hypothetical protein